MRFSQITIMSIRCTDFKDGFSNGKNRQIKLIFYSQFWNCSFTIFCGLFTCKFTDPTTQQDLLVWPDTILITAVNTLCKSVWRTLLIFFPTLLNLFLFPSCNISFYLFLFSFHCLTFSIFSSPCHFLFSSIFSNMPSIIHVFLVFLIYSIPADSSAPLIK